MKTVAIVQGRMSSSRLPGKILLEIAGKPMIQHVIERTQLTRSLDSVIVATTSDPSDDPVAAFAASIGIPCTRGSLHDVLDRYYKAAKIHQPDVIVRITADCPVIDPALIDEAVKMVAEPASVPGHSSSVDFACNRLPPPFTRSFPIGLDVEVCTFAALERAWKESTETFHREHVMPFLYEGVTLTPDTAHVSRGISPRGFRIAQLHHQPDYGSLRWTVDTPEDLTFIREIFARLGTNPLVGGKPNFTWYDVLEIVQKEPQLAEINAGVRHKTMTETDHRAPGN